jgi:Cu-Zn family superoxide dismutase
LHYNPYNKNHGDIKDVERHIGDLGNIDVDLKGNSYVYLIDSIMSLRGDFTLIGRSCTLHAMIDDLGKGNASDSLINGHAGARLACGNIGFAANNITLDGISFDDDSNFNDNGTNW